MQRFYGLAAAGLLTLCTPGCAMFETIFGCDGFHHGADCCGTNDCGCGHAHHHKDKCARKCRKCQKCLQEHGNTGGYGYGMDGMMLGGGGDCCGCGGPIAPDFLGGGIPSGYGAPSGCGCGAGGPVSFPGPGPSPMPSPSPEVVPYPPGAMPPGMSPSSEAAPAPTSGINLSYPQAIPAIPPSETGSLTPPAMQQVSVEEFQRLPGVVISGPTAGPSPSPQVASESSVPQNLEMPVVARPIQSRASSSAPVNARQVQQTGWAPVQR